MAAAALIGVGCQKDEGPELTVNGSGGGQTLGTGGRIAVGTPGSGGSAGADAGTGGAGAGTGGAQAMTGTGGSNTPDAALEVSMETAPPMDSAPEAPPLRGYKGQPWNNMPQAVPGIVQAPTYDMGGEGIAYHDADAINNGAVQAKASAPTSLDATFRPNEGVDLRTTRAGEDAYDNGGALQAGQLYVGWTQPGEWINYTIDVKETARYDISALIATMIDGTRVTFLLEDGSNTGPRALPWTHAYTAWHLVGVGALDITAGLHVLTMRFETPAVNVIYLSLQKM